jgi:hypothetical protein
MLDAEDMTVRRMTNGIIDVILKVCARGECCAFESRCRRFRMGDKVITRYREVRLAIFWVRCCDLMC